MDTQTHVWLGIIAIVSVLQFSGMLTVAIVASRKVRRAEALVEERLARLEMVTNEAIRDLRPVLKQASAALNDLADLSARLRQLDSQVSETVSSVSKGVRTASGVVLSRLWPAAGMLHAVAAGARALRARRRRARARADAQEISRFMNEGGANG
jgi:ABC-type transporter Mla subunit MlaD